MIEEMIQRVVIFVKLILTGNEEAVFAKLFIGKRCRRNSCAEEDTVLVGVLAEIYAGNSGHFRLCGLGGRFQNGINGSVAGKIDAFDYIIRRCIGT